MSKISVVIPIYNVEKYLARCLDSVINQTFKDLEIICVNDCSPDNSTIILNDYIKKDDRIRIINREKNGGLSAARITGLKNAKGKYIYFLDSDDWIKEDFLEKMYSKANELNLNALCCTNILNVFPDGTKKQFISRPDDGFVDYTNSCQMAWSWLLRRDFLERFDTIFPVGLKYEDLYFFHVIIRNLEKVYITNSTQYYHFENPSSIMGCSQNRTIDNFDIIECLKLIYNEYKKINKISVWSIPFFYMPKYMLNIHKNKPEFYLRLREFILSIKNDVMNNSSLYSKMELEFLDDILKHETYQEYKKLDISIIASLRRNIKK